MPLQSRENRLDRDTAQRSLLANLVDRCGFAVADCVDDVCNILGSNQRFARFRLYGGISRLHRWLHGEHRLPVAYSESHGLSTLFSYWVLKPLYKKDNSGYPVLDTLPRARETME